MRSDAGLGCSNYNLLLNRSTIIEWVPKLLNLGSHKALPLRRLYMQNQDLTNIFGQLSPWLPKFTGKQ